MDNSTLTLFKIKFKASIRKLEELLAIRDINNAMTLLEKMKKEANSLEIDSLDSFGTKLMTIQTNSFKKILASKEELEVLHGKFTDGCEAILNNKFQDETHKKESLAFVGVYQGMAYYKNDAKAYREALIAFCDWFKESIEKLEQLINEKNFLHFVDLAEQFNAKAQTIQAQEMLQFALTLNKIIVEDKNQCKIFLSSYQKSIEL
ncbi:MAG: hypothetical protein KU38_01480 [Sulfurovum sp. FS08-3]|nr:MAG: hypothetical protein KU38_01480 [Sulfurovum sp. FS08-3]